MSYGSKVEVKFVNGDDVYIVFPGGLMVGPVKVREVAIPKTVPFYSVVIPAAITGQADRVVSMNDERVFESEYDARENLQEELRALELVCVTMLDETDGPGGREIEERYPRGTSLNEVCVDMTVRLGLNNQRAIDGNVVGYQNLVFGDFPGDAQFKGIVGKRLSESIGAGRSMVVRLKKSIGTVTVHVSDGALDEDGLIVTGSYCEKDYRRDQTIGDVMDSICSDVRDNFVLVSDDDESSLSFDAKLVSFDAEVLMLTLKER